MPKRQRRPHPFPGTGAIMREARLRLGLSCEQLGELVGSNKGLVSNWELDKVWPQEAKLEELEKALGIKLPRRERNKTGRAATRSAECPVCTKTFPVFFGETYCSRACAAVGKSEIMEGRNLVGGYWVDNQGYVHIFHPDHPAADGNGYVREHRMVIEEKLGRLLCSTERVHHKNGERADNRPENLELWVKRGASSKDPPGQRMSDLIDFALSADSLRDMPSHWREAVRRSLYRTLLNEEQAEAPYDPSDDAKDVTPELEDF